MTSIIVKISRGTEIRRFTDSQASLSWSTLSKRVKELFELDASTRIKCTYVDDEGDKVTLSSNSELTEAVGIALKSSPAVLRLAVVDEPTTTNKTMPTSDKGSAADVEMTDAATSSDAKSTADAGTHAKPTTADAETPATAPTPDSVPESFAPLFATLAAQLPALVESLPPGVRNLIPHAELDIAATLAANATANASCAAAASGRAAQARAASNTVAGNTAAPPPANHAGTGVHLGVTCDKSGMSPIVGNRYNLVGHNYDVCQAEFDKLSEKEAELYVKIPPPFVHDMNGNGNTSAGNNHNGNNNNHHGGAEPPQGVHPGVECDRSGVCPIVGMRYNLRGHNYDLCQAEFDKLPTTEKLLYSAIPPPQQQQRGRCGPGGRGGWRNAMMGGVGGFPGGFPCAMGMGAGGTGMGMGGSGMGAGNGMGACPKLAARFVRDVTIFDGTQMAPSTSFTKIWRLKNSGEMPWPPGTRMLFVGGDQMTHEMSVPISHDGPVMPGEEVDVAVEMTAPADLGRYLGYWRLVGPHGRRKFGQRVWCHVQVVDPSQEAVATPPSDADLESTLAEIAKKKSDLAANEVDAHEDENDVEAQPLTTDGAGSSGSAAGPSAKPSLAAVGAAEPTASDAQTKAPAIDMSDADAGAKDSDDDSLVDVDSEALAEAVADELAAVAAAAGAAAKEGTGDMAVTASANPDPKTPAGVKALLGSMGFTDESLLEVVIQKHGADVEACARDLAAVSEWDNLLDDLAEMGFSNKALNKTLMLKHSGNIKRTVKELVEDA